jgi:hypothetical protein
VHPFDQREEVREEEKMLEGDPDYLAYEQMNWRRN